MEVYCYCAYAVLTKRLHCLGINTPAFLRPVSQIIRLPSQTNFRDPASQFGPAGPHIAPAGLALKKKCAGTSFYWLVPSIVIATPGKTMIGWMETMQ